MYCLKQVRCFQGPGAIIWANVVSIRFPLFSIAELSSTQRKTRKMKSSQIRKATRSVRTTVSRLF